MVAGRYLRAKRSQGGVAVISIISFIGITLAVAVLIIVMSVMNGFRAEMLSRMLGFNGHLYIAGGTLDHAQRDQLVGRVLAMPGVVSAVPVVETQAMVVGPTQAAGAIVRGMSAKDLKATRIVADNIKSGSLTGYGDGDYGGDMILVGKRLADAMGVRPGETLRLISPSGGATPFGTVPPQKSYVIAGTFEVGLSELDQAYIFMPLEQAQIFFGREDTVDAIELKLTDPDQAPLMKSTIADRAGPGSVVVDWTERNASLWGALQVERVVMRLILAMLVAIACMNIISGLIMLVKNKGRDIAILRTMGAGQGAIMRIFFMSGAAVGVVGTAAGLAIGSLFCIFIEPIQAFVEWATGAVVFSSDVYFLSHVPAKVDWVEVSGIVAFSLAMSFLATLLPARQAARLDPVEALRYE
jgi:lipoprotein-releasing system permease protein